MKRKSFYTVLMILLLSSCNTNNYFASSSEEIRDNGASDEFNPISLANDKNALGQYDNDAKNENRTIDDPLYDKIIAQKEILKVNETYIEDFEKDFLDSKLFINEVESTAECTIKNTTNASIDNNSLFLRSDGNYKGVKLGGMKFAKYGSYKIEYDYKIISPSNDFFFQIETPLGGTSESIYSTITGSSGKIGHNELYANLKGYDDYYIHLFPRDLSGAISFDNIKITRLNSKPVILNGKIDILDDKALLSYDYFDSEDDEEENSEIRWFSAFNNQGVNKNYLDNNSNELKITSVMEGLFLGVDITPISKGNDSQSIGLSQTFYSNHPITKEAKNINASKRLKDEESFIEDFENDIDDEYNVYFKSESLTSSVYYTNDAIAGDTSICFESDGAYSSSIFEGIKYDAKGIYLVEFDYKFITKCDNFYIQFRSNSGYTASDVFTNINMQSVIENEINHFSYEFSLNNYNDYYLMMFPAISSCKVIIDNIKITKKSGYNNEIQNVKLNVNEEISENFDDLANLKIGIDKSQTPNCKITSENAIENNSLYIESSGQYKCLFINKGIEYEANSTYKVTFTYKITSLIDTLYFQLNNGSDTIYKQFGNENELNKIFSFEFTFTIKNNTNYVIQIFPGQKSGVSKLYIDNFIIKRIK